MALHVDGGSPRLRIAARPSGLGGDHLFHARKAAPDHAPAPQRDAGDQRLRSAPDRPASGYRRPAPRSPPRRRRISSVGSSPPATPKLMTPRIVDGSNTVSSARNCCGSLLLQMTVMPGPAAMRASCTKTSHNQAPAAGQSIARGRVDPPPPNSHSDPYHPAVGVPQIPIPRQRPERKELRIPMIAQIKYPRKACCRVALLVPQPFFGLCGY